MEELDRPLDADGDRVGHLDHDHGILGLNTVLVGRAAVAQVSGSTCRRTRPARKTDEITVEAALDGLYAVAAYRTHGADRIVAEVNQGGDMVENTIRIIDPNVACTAVRASRGKVTRAEPVSALYEQGRVHHLGVFPELEDQMCAFTADVDRAAGSPDRVDALVWAISELMVAPMRSFGIFELYRQMAEEQTTRESALITAPHPRQRRHEAILAERLERAQVAPFDRTVL
jgi:hypothetical protein